MAANYPLTRSIVNESIARAKACFERFGVALPPFAFWTAADWAGKGPEVDELRACMLGWDVTDFGSLRFHEIGRVLFTLRNGTSRVPGYPKVYAEKFLFDPENQRAPAHYHRSKMEDICCRAGGNVLVQLTALGADGRPSEELVRVKVDGQATTMQPRGIVRLRPGMSVNIPPRTIHQFWGEEGTGETLSSEVSSVCDDLSDNVFFQDAVRFPPLVEDAPKHHLLCHEYPPAASR